MRTNRHLDNNRGATMFEAAIGVVLLLFSILAGVDLVRLAYTTAIIQYEVVRGTRLANLEANSNRTGFGGGATYQADLANDCSNAAIYLSACGGAATDCTSQRRVCGLRKFIRDNIVIRALSGELSATTNLGPPIFTISSAAPGATTFTLGNTGNPGDLLIVDLNINVQLVSPLRIVVGDTLPIRASSVGKNEF